jgi:hypothetical protein
MVSTAMQGGCVCENASHLRVGTGNIEFAALCVPRPLGMTGADDWTREIETKGLPELKTLYRLFGVEDRVMARCFPSFPHNYNQVSRELMYSWMNRHLSLGLQEPVEEKPFEPIEPKDLSVFDADHPRPADAVDAASLRRFLTATSDRQMLELWPRTAWSLDRYRRVIGSALEAMAATRLPSPWQVESRKLAVESLNAGSQNAGSQNTRGKTIIEKLLLFRQGSGEEVPAITLTPESWNGAILIAIHPGGKKAVLADEQSGGLAKPVSAALEKGFMVIAVDVFRTGELAPPDGEQPAGPPAQKYAGYFFGYNRCTLANRVHDILTAIAFAQGRGRNVSVRLAGYQRAGIWVALARALAGEAVARTVIEDDGFRFSEILAMNDPMLLPGALKYGDVPGYLALCAPAEIALLRQEGEAEPLVRDAYLAAGAANRLKVFPRSRKSMEEAWEWLMK